MTTLDPVRVPRSARPEGASPSGLCQNNPWGLGSGALAKFGLIALFLVLTWTTWARWGDLRIDSGREMYVPFEITQGQLLYGDLWYPYGPLAPYLNALLFRLFGAHLLVLYIAGLVETLLYAALLFALSRRFLPVSGASVVSACFLLQAFRPELFNFVLPYAYAATLGSLFSLVCLYALVRHVLLEPGPNLAVAGTAAGLALLAKQEFGVVSYLTFGFVLLADALRQRSSRVLFSGLLRSVPGLAINAAVYGWFAWRFTPSFILLENFHITPQSEFMRTLGWHWLQRNGLRFEPAELLALFVGLGFSLAVWFTIAYLLRYRFAGVWVLLLLSIGFAVSRGIPAAIHYLTFVATPVVLFPKGMYGVTVAFFVWSVLRWIRSGDRYYFAICVLSLNGLALGIRIVSDVVPFGYAIFYNSVLFLLFVCAITRTVVAAAPSSAAGRQATFVPIVLAIEACGLLVGQFSVLAVHPEPLYTKQGVIYGRQNDVLGFREAISFVEQQRIAGKRVLLLPEEASLYFFTGTRAPTRWYALTPGVLTSKDSERRYIAEARQQEIEYILLSNRGTAEYGLPFFGLDFNQDVYHWIQEDYEVVGEVGKFSRERPQEFGMLVYRKRRR